MESLPTDVLRIVILHGLGPVNCPCTHIKPCEDCKLRKTDVLHRRLVNKRWNKLVHPHVPSWTSVFLPRGMAAVDTDNYVLRMRDLFFQYALVGERDYVHGVTYYSPKEYHQAKAKFGQARRRLKLTTKKRRRRY